MCGDEDFDVTMVYYDGADVSELVGSYLLKKVSNIVDKKSIGLYRDDGLAVLQNLSGPQIQRKRKDIKMFKLHYIQQRGGVLRTPSNI